MFSACVKIQDEKAPYLEQELVKCSKHIDIIKQVVAINNKIIVYYIG